MTGTEVRVGADPVDTARLAADVVEGVIRETPDAVLALPTGRTPLPLYADLARRYAAGRVDFGRVRAFNLDEWVGVPPNAPGSYARFMDENFYARVNLPPEHRHIPNGMAPDLDAECARYEAEIRDAGGLDLAVLGIGRNGHIGFNEPGTPPDSRTHVAHVAEDTRRVNAYGFPDGRPPERALTVGIATIMDAREILLIVTGAEKADILARAFSGPVSADVPASILQRHPKVVIVGDRAATSTLR